MIVTQVWIASHLTSSKQNPWLLSAIQSCESLPVILSISGQTEYLDGFLENVRKNKDMFVNVKWTIRKKMYQFDHLAQICNESKLTENDIVIFLDDDDILLNVNTPIFDTVNAYLGYQILGIIIY